MKDGELAIMSDFDKIMIYCVPSTAYAMIEDFKPEPENPIYDDPDFFLDCLGSGNDRTVKLTKGGADLSDEDFQLKKSGTETGGDYSFDQTKAYRKR